MLGRFNPPLKPEDIAEALLEGKMYPFAGGYYLEHRNVGLILKSRITAACHFYVVTVMNLDQGRFFKAGLSPPKRFPFKSVVVL